MRYQYKIYFADRPKNRILCWDPDTGKLEVVVSSLREPYGLAADSKGNLLIADKNNHRICRLKEGKLEKIDTFDLDNHRQKRFASQNDNPDSPAGLFWEDKGTLLVCYSDDNTIYRVHPDGKLELVLGLASDHNVFAGAAQEVPEKEVKKTPIHMPTSVVAQKDGTIFFIERGFQTVRQYRPDQGFHSIFPLTFDRKFQNATEIPIHTHMDAYCPIFPTALAIQGDVLFLADGIYRCVFEIHWKTREMNMVMKSSPHASKQEPGPVGLALGPDNTLWVLDIADKCLQGFQKSEDQCWKKVSVECSFPPTDPVCGSGGVGMVCL